MDNQTERLARKRWWLVLIYLMGGLTCVFLKMEIVRTSLLLRGFPVDLILLGGLVVWGIALVLLIAIAVRVRRDRHLRGVLHDELTKANQRRAQVAGFYAMLFALAGAVVATVFHWTDPLSILLMLIIVAVSVPLLYFLWLERESAV